MKINIPVYLTIVSLEIKKGPSVFGASLAT
jgi:hypothetical protein